MNISNSDIKHYGSLEEAIRYKGDGLTINGSIYIRGCTDITSLPDGLTVGGYLDIRGCTDITSLPDGLTVGGSLDIRGCTGITSLPDGLTVGGYLYMSDCTGITSLPDGLTVGGYLDIRGCTGLEHFRINDIQDPRDYVAYKIPMADGLHICSGCRNLKIDDALEHWGKNYRGDRKIGDMYFVAIQNIKKESEKCA